jgi:hypothetical protein
MSAASPARVAGSPLTRELYRLEIALANRDGTGIDGGLAALIADDFLEIGASGRRWTAAEVRTLLAAGALGPLPSLELEAFEAADVAEDVVLVTYRLGGERPSERSSVWVRRGGRWQVRFHQGTLLPI